MRSITTKARQTSEALKDRQDLRETLILKREVLDRKISEVEDQIRELKRAQTA